MGVTLPATGTGTATPIVSTDNITADSSQVQNIQSVVVSGGVLTRITPGTAIAPHIGVNGDPWSLTSKTAQYTSTQTSAVLQAGAAGEKIVVTSIQIQVGGTTNGALQVYFGTGAYSRGTNRAIFDGEFAPSNSVKPGVVMKGPFIAGATGDDVMVTTSAAINPLTVTIWYYVVT